MARGIFFVDPSSLDPCKSATLILEFLNPRNVENLELLSLPWNPGTLEILEPCIPETLGTLQTYILWILEPCSLGSLPCDIATLEYALEPWSFGSLEICNLGILT